MAEGFGATGGTWTPGGGRGNVTGAIGGGDVEDGDETAHLVATA